MPRKTYLPFENCLLCGTGFPLDGKDHIPTQSLGMIPVLRCRKAITRLDIKRFRDFLNSTDNGPRHRQGRYRQVSRKYGDYLYAQDREKFINDLCEWLPNNP